MSIVTQTDRELAAAGQMLCNEVTKIARELRDRGVEVDIQGYYRGPRNDNVEWDFECKRVTTEIV